MGSSKVTLSKIQQCNAALVPFPLVQGRATGDFADSEEQERHESFCPPGRGGEELTSASGSRGFSATE